MDKQKARSRLTTCCRRLSQDHPRRPHDEKQHHWVTDSSDTMHSLIRPTQVWTMCTPAPTRRAPTDNLQHVVKCLGIQGREWLRKLVRILISRMCSGILRESLCSSGYRWNSWPRCPACLLLSDPARARSGSQGRPPHTSCCHGFFYHRQAKVPAITRRAYPGRVPKIHPRRPDHEEHKNLGDPTSFTPAGRGGERLKGIHSGSDETAPTDNPTTRGETIRAEMVMRFPADQHGVNQR